ncbi:hypothetical protein AB0876_10630 [Mycobacterium sp. NPDC049093]|jgi:hypothetical protein
MMTEHETDEENEVLDDPRPAGPTGLHRLDTVAELTGFPDGTVVIWHSWNGLRYERQAGVLDTAWGGERKVRPVTIHIVEFDTDLDELEPPLWVLTFEDSREASDGQQVGSTLWPANPEIR